MGNTLCTTSQVDVQSRGFRRGIQPPFIVRPSNSRFNSLKSGSGAKNQKLVDPTQMMVFKDIFNVIKYKNGDFYYGQVKAMQEVTTKRVVH